MDKKADKQPTEKEIHEHKAERDKYYKAIRRMEKRIRKDKDGALVLDAKNAKEVGVDSQIFDELRQALEETNRRVKAGELRSEDILLSTPEPAP